MKFSLLTFFLCITTIPAQEAILESAREIPVAYDVDVVVVGGTTGAITAAVEAANKGASVFLAALRPYLGEDVAGTLRLWLDPGDKPESPLEKALFERADPGTGFPNRLLVGGNDRASQVPGGTLFSTCPALRPRWDLGVLPSCAKMLPSAFITASAPTNKSYGAQSHGLQNPCIRFVVGLPFPTQYSVPAAGTLGRAGFNTRRVPSKVSENIDAYISSPFPRLGLAQYEI